MSAPVQVLLVDDEASIRRSLAPLLRSQGYAVTTAAGGQEALDLFQRHHPDLIVLDLGLPDMDGLEVCKRVRDRSETPILVLSVRGAERDKVAALDEGADDYVTKPFGPDEFMARVRAALRRSPTRDQSFRGRMQAADLTIDFDRRRVYRGELEIRLTPKEFELLTLLASQPGRVLTHRTILRAIWGTHGAEPPEVLRVLMGQLRKKIEADPGHPKYLVTEPWVGYRFMDDL